MLPVECSLERAWQYSDLKASMVTWNETTTRDPNDSTPSSALWTPFSFPNHSDMVDLQFSEEKAENFKTELSRLLSNASSLQMIVISKRKNGEKRS